LAIKTVDLNADMPHMLDPLIALATTAVVVAWMLVATNWLS